ncbi:MULTISPECIES: M4 family metallopeptidase [unclassified Duganella]|jgi:Zn-dependent metalloprotease|uniref:M4 family metallopeptidase n=1 Tax=unclassified Duganella TaxID=2636909 RepID=UPI0008910F69|nr:MULTISPECIES: M4 family metallopeptidase [unclassified Duganella]SDF50208.1 Thermolysin metallopeptidase, catalytic domain [Duganella sp. OV458]SDI76786.1 Thermolysin metallopeptidase, catalytic domain [Duganella sp. OV510]
MAEHPHGCTCFIVPPKMLRKLAEQTQDATERHCLLDAAEISAHLRGQRSVAPVVLGIAAAATGEKRRTVYDAQNKSKLPGKLARGEDSKPSTDVAVNQAYDGAGATYDFYREVLKRNSIDGKGMRLESTVHYQSKFNNAFWNGQQMVYGDGDGKLFLGFTGALDVIAHELTHGVTQFAVPGGLVYEDQSGALNESISDVFGSVVKQWTLKQNVEQADWLIGAGIMAPSVGKALRSMADPGNQALTWSGDDQPKNMSGYIEDGDVHTNSGIPNHAFYAAAIALKGNSWDKAGPIWYKALGLLTPNATFADMANATTESAALLYGADSAEQHAIQAAWKVVGVT